MLKKMQYPERPEKEELKKRLKAAKEELFSRQMKLKEHKLPVIVLMEGWGTSGKGAIIGSVIQSIDPRFFKVAAITVPTTEEKRKPWLARFFDKIPEAGKFQFYDSGWMDEVTRGRLSGMDDATWASRIESVKRFERTLTDNGYLVFKFFCDISKKEQKKRIKALKSDLDTKWRVDSYDKWQNRHHEECVKVFDEYFEATNTPNAPWYMIDAEKQKWAELQILEIINDGLKNAMQNESRSVPIMQNVFKMKKVPLLKDIPLNKTISDEEYDKELKELQEKLSELHNRLYRMKVPVVICYEGWDAAGKGGNIKRITGALDPRGYEVIPIASPEPHEKARHFLWRFYTRLPKDGHIAIFDRTWYGRVMVERLEGFCSENDWKRAYNEMNEFEKELKDWGAVIIKFWVQIDKETQLKRFTDRQNTPEKQWKITDEDWRNREKWDAYEEAVNEMLEKTSTEFAPWHILESNDKKYARIKALRIVAGELEKRLK
ncbi:MAG: polyphosphate:AMP phosphotransferase [Lachnospiraceae bacterium]|nr:polyphosphate:AMP phosphotransferase [Lachnospiraceae bacterium]